MEIISEIQTLRQFIRQMKGQEKSIGFVPTMGALHDGHIELIRASKKENDITICSIFVNPTQFNNPKDLENYPHDTHNDIEKLIKAKCDALFIPSADLMYEKEPILNFHFGYLEEIMEGKCRPGHFKGVGLIIAKLFNLTEPNRAYFGTKDLQQLTVIRKLANELFFNIQIIPVKTVRESDGLAMSSRNRLLSASERKSSINLYQALLTARRKLNEGESVELVQNHIVNYFKSEHNIELEYFEIVNTTNLRKISEIDNKNEVSLCIAGQLGKVRLIDNISLN